MKSARKKHLKEVLSISHQRSPVKQKGLSFLEIKFTTSNMSEIISTHDDPMVILAIMVNAEVKRVLRQT